MDHVDRVVSELAESLGLGDGLDDEGKLVLLIDERWLVTLAVDQDQNHLLAFAKISDQAPESPAALRALLKGNFLWRATRDATIAIEPETEALVLHWKIQIEGLDVKRLRSAIENLVKALQTWEAVIAETATQDTEASDLDDGRGTDVDLSKAIRV